MRNNYRIYALIHGQTLEEGEISKCFIKRMTFEEQTKRNFSPIKSVFSDSDVSNFHKTYVTSLPYVDPIKIKSEYVIYFDIEEGDVRSALGGAIRAIDRVARFLSLANLKDVKQKYGENRGSFEPYIYQVNKIYLLDKNEEKEDVDFQLESGHIYLPDRPERNQWMSELTESFLNESLGYRDEVFERALKYLYRASIGYLIFDSEEKRALDHFKSIEIIVNSLGVKRINKKKTTFIQRLDDVASKIGIKKKERDVIKRFWDERSTFGDVAHPANYDRSETYPNQFPLPGNTWYTGSSFDNVSPSILLKYYKYKKSIYTIEVFDPEKNNVEGSFCEIYEISQFGPISRNQLHYYTIENNKTKLIQNLKKGFAEEYNLSTKNIIETKILPKTQEVIGKKKIRIRICMTI